MLWRDPLYGEWETPDFIEDLVHTSEMARLRGITQDVLPNRLLPFCMHSRFEHSLGVCLLALKVLEQNPHLKDLKTILPVSALLHDAGSPPFSYLSEHFLKELTGLNGEGFLKNILNKSEAEKILKGLKIDTSEMVAWVTGNAKPHSDILHGSIDIDNLDNVTRYHQAIKFKPPNLNPVEVAEAFSFWQGSWCVFTGFREELSCWQRLREEVYEYVYGEPHLNIATMVYRALELAFEKGEINLNFFFLDDDEAFSKLLHCSNPQTSYLMEQAWRFNWYKRVVGLHTYEPTDQIIHFCRSWMGRSELAKMICEEFKLPPEKICVYTGLGKDNRSITLPWQFDKKLIQSKTEKEKNLYRVNVYVDQDIYHEHRNGGPRSVILRERIADFVHDKLYNADFAWEENEKGEEN